ncbi:DNA-binding response regulator [Streptomyces sp. SID486]|uniref:LuxR C-terminal-related transcriptional regulator n=1 Tax=Streptomyces sp. SID486 TaxID=2690264 RepID=UPI0013714894|nr:LuxR C-terminal-related transcriptional regulator [Streptomyces sp. SID486]MYW21337.1 DNA-binding response regulator [Streptomyces sp. SID2955]MYX97441.1 DNA-binding response regulator [Streptomyces sp. SID486]
MPDEEELCRDEIARSLRALLRDVNEMTHLLRILVEQHRPNPDPPVPAPNLPDSKKISLTDRESDVYQLLVTGMSNRQIGRRLGIAERTVKNNLHSIYRKLGVSGRAETIAQHFSTPVRRGTPPPPP